MEWRNVQKAREDFFSIFNGAKSIIVFDTETTGLGSNAKIIEFAAVRYEICPNGLKETHKIDLFLNPEEALSEKIIELTGITDKILEKANSEIVEASNIYTFLDSADIWAAYNCSFDIRMLCQMSKRTGIDFCKKPCLDVLQMARDFVKKEDVENHKLQTICKAIYPEKVFRFHQAIDDVRATALIMAKFIGNYFSYGQDEENKKRQCRLNWAYYCINPSQKSQIRIKLNLSEGQYGDIYWDVRNKLWSCKKTSSAKKLFQAIDLANLEKQVLSRYGYKFGNANNMETLAQNWGKAQREHQKNVSA